MELTGTHNINKIPHEVIAIAYYLFHKNIKEYENAYMIEVKIDDPLKHIKEGNENFIIYADPSQYYSSAKHFFDEEWTTIHKDIFKNVKEKDISNFETILKKMFESD